MKSRFKGNINCHVKDCVQQKLQKEQKADNEICQCYGKRFKQKLNKDHHVKSQHEDDTVNVHTDAGKIVDDSVVPLTFVPEFEPDFRPGTSNQPSNATALDIDSKPHQTTPQDSLNVSFRSNEWKIIDAAMAEIEHKTPIYEIFELFLNFSLSPVRDTNYAFNNINNEEPNKQATLPNVTLKTGEELIRMAEKPESNFENSFKQ